MASLREQINQLKSVESTMNEKLPGTKVLEHFLLLLKYLRGLEKLKGLEKQHSFHRAKTQVSPKAIYDALNEA